MNTSRLHDLAKLNILLYVPILSKLTLCAHWPLRSYAVKCLSARMGEVIDTEATPTRNGEIPSDER